MPRLVDSAPQYFRDGFVSCGQCGNQVDLWKAVLEDAVRTSMATSWALAALGAGKTNFVMPMETGKYYPVELSSHDVPADAKILTRNYTSQGGGVTAMEQHGNAPPLRFPGTMLRLFGVPLGEGPLPRVGKVSINVVWIRSGDSEAWSYLVTACSGEGVRAVIGIRTIRRRDFDDASD